MYISVSICYMCVDAQICQKKVLDPLELGLQLVMDPPSWVFGWELPDLLEKLKLFFTVEPSLQHCMPFYFYTFALIAIL